MKIADVNVGGRYVAKVSGVLTVVRVTEIYEAWSALDGRTRRYIDVVNERTGRRATLRSAARLRRPAPARGKGA
ncbi:MAG: hypothetical protein KIS87_10535 [Phycisphaeraceae bacterium]|nr:hypothetical protein [Phycisphaeraceae bacterium]